MRTNGNELLKQSFGLKAKQLKSLAIENSITCFFSCDKLIKTVKNIRL